MPESPERVKDVAGLVVGVGRAADDGAGEGMTLEGCQGATADAEGAPADEDEGGRATLEGREGGLEDAGRTAEEVARGAGGTCVDEEPPVWRERCPSRLSRDDDVADPTPTRVER